jgi:hypothetical protein
MPELLNDERVVMAAGVHAIGHVLGEGATRAALVGCTQIQQAYVGYVYEDSTSRQSALSGLLVDGR